MLSEVEELELLELEKEKSSLGIEDVYPILNDYVKPDKSKGLTEGDILDLIRNEISQIPKVKPQKVIERIVEKQIVKEAVKDTEKETRKFAEEKSVEDLKKEVTELKDLLEKFKQILPMLGARGGSGVLGLPIPTGQSGKFLTTDGNQFSWATVSSNSDPLNIGDPTVDGNWRITVSGTNLSFQRRESGTFVEKGTMTP